VTLTSEEREAFLEADIPYRMTAVEGMVWACAYLTKYGDTGPLWVRFGKEGPITSETVRILTNPVIEVGALYCRVLLEFMGLKLDRNATPMTLKEGFTRRNDDVGIEHFDLPRVTLADFGVEYVEQPEWPGQAAATALHIADKALAHLTRTQIDRKTIPQLHDCGIATISLVERHLYRALDRAVPDYLKWPWAKPTPSANVTNVQS
jgi:hypothetical protein